MAQWLSWVASCLEVEPRAWRAGLEGSSHAPRLLPAPRTGGFLTGDYGQPPHSEESVMNVLLVDSGRNIFCLPG